MGGPRKYRQQDYSEGEWRFSKLFRYQVSRHPMPLYVLGKACGIRQTTCYRWVRGDVPVSRTDKRVLKLIQLVNLTPEVALTPFESNQEVP